MRRKERRVRKRKEQKYFPVIGTIFGKLTLIRIIKPTNEIRYTQWICRCECGVEKHVTPHRLYIGRVTSCGCMNVTRAVEMGRKNALKEGNSNENKIISSYKYAAKQRDLEFALTKEECRILFKSNCFYCGEEPSRTVLYENSVSPFTFNGIDRVDNNLGYTSENSVSCCTKCNKGKNNMTLDEFKSWINNLCNNLFKPLKS